MSELCVCLSFVCVSSICTSRLFVCMRSDSVTPRELASLIRMQNEAFLKVCVHGMYL